MDVVCPDCISDIPVDSLESIGRNGELHLRGECPKCNNQIEIFD